MTKHAEPGERRRVQRVRLPELLPATVNGARAFLVDLSLKGARVLHQDDIGRVSSECIVRTQWDGHRIELHCTIVRTALHKPSDHNGRTLYHSGLQITHAGQVSTLTLRRLIEHHVERALDEQKANARGIPPRLAAQSHKTGAPSTFVRHEYAMGRWREVMTATAAQPENGFTIGAQTTPAEVEMLRRAYEAATSASDLAVIRKMAAMSVSSGEVVQARRYTP